MAGTTSGDDRSQPPGPWRTFSVDYSGPVTAEAFVDDVLDLLMRKHGLDVDGASDVPWESTNPDDPALPEWVRPQDREWVAGAIAERERQGDQ